MTPELTGVDMPSTCAGAYRVFSCDGSNTDDVLLAAADRALSDGMDIINMCGQAGIDASTTCF